MRTPQEVAHVIQLSAEGLNQSEIARVTRIPHATVVNWLHGRTPDFQRRRTGRSGPAWYPCPVCTGQPDTLPREAYVYLLGLYLGDGYLAKCPKGVYRLDISCTDTYPVLMQRCEDAMAAVLPTKVGRRRSQGCTNVYSTSKHWPCIFPQHGPGMKHTRKIELVDWQQALVDLDPRPLVRGLIHSDGCRVLNRAYGTDYPPYPRYHFDNASDDIRKIFTDACDALGVEWRQSRPRTISVAKRASVAKLDAFIGPKT